ncbi:MAG TPA: tetratricopeptide repeat protein [Bacteroidia bacterium]|jgi:tetratricopeptide (TPR) repeat protein
MSFRLRFCVIIPFIACFHLCKADNTVDSLKKLIDAHPAEDTVKVDLYNRISHRYKLLSEYENAGKNAQKAKALAEKLGYDAGFGDALINLGTVELDKSNYQEAIGLFEQSIVANKKAGNHEGIATGLQNKGLVLQEIGDLDAALECAMHALEELKNASSSTHVLIPVIINIGNIRMKKGDFPGALDYYFKALKEIEKEKNEGDITVIYNNIAGVYQRQNDFENAIVYTEKSLHIREKNHDRKGVSQSYNNLGNIYALQKNFTLALDYLNKAYTIRKELGLKRGMASTLEGLAGVYSELGQYDKAIEIHLQARSIYEEIGNKDGIVDCIYNLGLTYFQKEDFKKALECFLHTLDLSKQNQLLEYISSANQSASECYSKLGDWKNAMSYYKNYIVTRDSMYNKENTKKIVQSQMTYEFSRKEALAKAEQDKKDALADSDRQKERFIRNTLIGGVLVVCVFALFVLRSYRQKRKANVLLEEQKKKIAQQKELVDEKNKEILDSIHYAQRIQAAILPPGDELRRSFPESFLLFLPKDIVSGDFYWVSEREEFIFYAVCDCTGHGVPGSFMSMLGTALLNEVVNEKKITEPADILDMLRVKIILALKQRGVSGENKDGMDMCLVRINKQKTELVYAAANNSLYLVRNGELTDHKGDKQPVGISGGNSMQFSQHCLLLRQGDCIYAFTDGYADQFGGPKGKKFKYRQLEELLVLNASRGMNEQKEILENKFLSWKSDHAQVDDVCAIGIKI